MLLIGTALLGFGGLGVVSEDRDIYPRVRWYCGGLALLGAVLLWLAVQKVIHA